MKSKHDRDHVFYPPVGIAHITHNIAHLLEPKIKGKSLIRVKSSAQPNSNPHLGTVMTLMTGFALAKHFSQHYSVPSEYLFDALDNSPGEKIDVRGISYCKGLKDTFEAGESLAERYLKTFTALLDKISKRSGVEYSIRRYDEFQQLAVVRRTIVSLIAREKDFEPLISPSERRLHFRFPCPVCGYTDKSSLSVKVIYIEESSVSLSATCFDHGEHAVVIGEHTSDFIDANTPIRDILQGVLSLEEDRDGGSLTVMLDGGDWSGVWALRVFCSALMSLGYDELPLRFFAPVILDWSGAKFSKSLYLRSDAYNYLPTGLIDFGNFEESYGDAGFEKLWKEAVSWVAEPKKLFRDYSIDYFNMILNY